MHQCHSFSDLVSMAIKIMFSDDATASMKPLTSALASGIQNRFQATLNSDEYRIATKLHPKFKLAFLQDEQERMQGRQLLLTYVQQVQRDQVAGPTVSSAGSALNESEDDEDLYSFLKKPMESTCSLSEEVSGYLACKADSVTSLQSYPSVALAFRKSNATLPSSAAVEHLFSAASQVLCARRCRMSDETLDKLVFLQSRLK